MASDWTRFEQHKTLPQSSGRWRRRRNEPLSSGKTNRQELTTMANSLRERRPRRKREFVQSALLVGPQRGARDWMRSAGWRGLDVTYPAPLAALLQAGLHGAAQVARDTHRGRPNRSATSVRADAAVYTYRYAARTINVLLAQNAGDGCCARRHKRTPPRTRTNTRAAGDSSKRECRRLYKHARKPCTNERVRAHVQTHRRERMNERADKVAGPDFVAAGRMNFSSRQVPLQSTV